MSDQKNFIVYRSSAGSGKTYTLVLDYLKLALKSSHPESFRKILAITFTNKAAEEMKDRVLLALQELEENPQHALMSELEKAIGVSADEIRKRAKATLQSMLHNYSDLAISTIDKFMHQLVRSFSRDLALNYDFEVETDSQPFVEEAVAQILESVGTDKHLTNILLDWVKHQVDEDRSWQIERNLNETTKSRTGQGNSAFLAELEDYPTENFEELKKSIIAFNTSYEKELSKIAQQAIEVIHSASLSIDDFYQKKSGIYGFFKKTLESGQYKQPNSYVRAFVEDEKHTSSKDAAIISAIAGIADSLSGAVQAIEALAAAKHGTFLISNILVKNLHELMLINELNKKLQMVKEDHNVIFVNDFNALISSVIKNEPAPFIYERIGQRYQHLLIDEFQDTSVVQWQNFLPLVTHALSSNGKSMIVGDGKQAIYRWRGGEVEQFSKLPEIYTDSPDEFTLERQMILERNFNDSKKLEKNYRSLGEVVKFNNTLYEFLREDIPEGLKSVYNEVTQKIHREENAGLVTLHLMDGKDKEELEEQYLSSTKESIEQCLSEGYSQRDICIITRGKKEANIIVNNLNGEDVGECKLEFISNESLLIDNNPSVQLMLSALGYLSAPEDLRQQLTFLIELVHRNTEAKNRHAVLSDYTHRNGKSALVEVKINAYLKKNVAGWNNHQLVQLGLVDLVEEVARKLSFADWNHAYWLFFKENITRFTTRHGNDLPAFLNWWEQNVESLSLSAPPDSDAISIMTIHKAKGLQFAVVILPFADWNFKIGTAKHWLKTPDSFSKEIGSEAPKVLISTINKALKDSPLLPQIEAEESRILLDNLNLLYVATTRAEERLYILSREAVPNGNPSNVAHWLTMFAQKQPDHEIPICFGKQGARSSYFSAEKNNSNEAENETLQGIDLTVASTTGWRDKIQISLEANSYLPGELMPKSRVVGNLIHRMLAELEKPEQLDMHIAQYLNRGHISADQAKEIKSQIEIVFKNPTARSWFDKHDKVFVEHAINLLGGETIRPDRVIINGKTATVIDYKTGAPKPEHEAQIMGYGQALSDMGYQPVLYLCYLETAEVKPVDLSPQQTTLF